MRGSGIFGRSGSEYGNTMSPTCLSGSEPTIASPPDYSTGAKPGLPGSGRCQTMSDIIQNLPEPMSFATIEATQLARQIEDGQAPIILDARTRLNDSSAGEALWRTSHIPGALHADMDRDLAAPPSQSGGRHPLPEPNVFSARLRDWGISPQRSVVVYDDTGGRLAAARAWWMLKWAGHPDVRVLDGGWQSWQAQGLPLESRLPAQPQSSDWQPEFDDTMIADAAEVAQGRAVLLDARAPERFRGEHEPMDPKAGHIPGARNVPGASLLDEQQQFMGDDKLAAALPADEDIIAYCGSGVSACHLILAYARLGNPLPRLYPGSWSAWCADPSRPVATGADG